MGTASATAPPSPTAVPSERPTAPHDDLFSFSLPTFQPPSIPAIDASENYLAFLRRAERGDREVILILDKIQVALSLGAWAEADAYKAELREWGRSEATWLRSNSPDDCYRAAHEARLVSLDAVATSGDLDVDEINEITRLIGDATIELQLTTCP